MIDQQARPFTQFLQEQRRGALHEELSTQLADVVNAVMDHVKPGVVTLTLKIKPAGDSMVSITDEVAIKTPTADRLASLFFVDGRGNVQRQNPRQPELPLHDIAGDAA